MPASSFDFDVITGPSAPRDERSTPRPQQPPQTSTARGEPLPPKSGPAR